MQVSRRSIGMPVPRPDWDLLEPLLRCPSCGENALSYDGGPQLACEACGVTFPVEGRIVDFSAATARNEPAFYKNALYRTFIGKLDAIHEAHYGSRFSGGVEQRMKQDMMRLVTPGAGPSVDLGCGTGEGLDLVRSAEGTIGVDVQMSLLRAAAERFPSFTFICTDLANLPFRSAALSRIFSNAVLEHVFHLERTVEHVERCLAPHGRVFVGVPTEGSLAVAVARYFTSRRNAALTGLTPPQSRDAQRMDHCNTVDLIDNVIRKYFIVEATSLWPFNRAPQHFNLFKSYRLKGITPEPLPENGPAMAPIP